MSEIEKRIDRIIGNLQVDAILVFNWGSVDKNFFYLSGLYYGVFEGCGILCDREGKTYLFTTPLEEGLSREVNTKIKNAEIVVFKDKEDRNRKLKSILSKYKMVGLNFDFIPYSVFTILSSLACKVKWIDAGKVLRKSRMVKSKDEIEKIKKACGIVSEIADDIPTILKEGMAELDLAAEIEYSMKKKGANGQSFKTIVSFAANTSKPH